MAGERERLRWVLDLTVDDAGVREFIRNTRARIQELTQAASQVGRNLTAGGPAGQGIAAELGRELARIEEFNRRVQASRAGLSAQTLREFRSFAGTGANVGAAAERQVIGAAASLPRGFREERFRETAAEAAALERQSIAQLRQQVTEQQALTEIARRMGALASGQAGAHALAAEAAQQQAVAEQATATQMTRREAMAKAMTEAAQRNLAIDYEEAGKAAENLSIETQTRAVLERILLADRDYLQATAEITNLRRAQQAIIRQQALAGAGLEEEAPGFGFKGTGQFRDAQGRFASVAAARAAAVQDVLEREAANNVEAERQSAVVKLQEAQLRRANIPLLAESAAAERLTAAQLRSEIAQREAASAALIQAKAQTAVAERQVAAQVTQERQRLLLSEFGPASTLEIEGQNRAREAQIGDRRRVAELRQTLASEDGLRLAAQRKALQEQLNVELRRRVAAERRAAYQAQLAQGAGPEIVGTRFQRLQAGIAARGGNFRAPTEFLQLGQFIRSRFLTTAGFALSGITTYGLFQGIRRGVEETANLQREFASLRAQLVAIGEEDRFDEITGHVRELATETGVAASKITNIRIQLQGAFGADATQEFIDRQTEAALKISRVTGLPVDEINDSLTAIAFSFETNFDRVGEVALGLRDRFGVLSREIITAAADLAPVAAEAGATFEQTAAVVAAAQRSGGRSGAAIAEALGRILPQVTVKIPDLIGIYAEAGLDDARQKILQSAGQGEIFDVIIEVIKSLGLLEDRGQEQFADRIITLLGERRETSTLLALARRANEPGGLIAELQSFEDDPARDVGRLESEWERFQETIGQTFARLRQTLTQLAVSVADLGLIEFFTGLGEIINALLTPVRLLAELLGGLNDIKIPGLDQGLASTLLQLGIAYKLFSTLGAGRLLGGSLLGRVPGVAGRRAASARDVWIGASPTAVGALEGAATVGVLTRGTQAFRLQLTQAFREASNQRFLGASIGQTLRTATGGVITRFGQTLATGLGAALAFVAAEIVLNVYNAQKAAAHRQEEETRTRAAELAGLGERQARDVLTQGIRVSEQTPQGTGGGVPGLIQRGGRFLLGPELFEQVTFGALDTTEFGEVMQQEALKALSPLVVGRFRVLGQITDEALLEAINRAIRDEGPLAFEIASTFGLTPGGAVDFFDPGTTRLATQEDIPRIREIIAQKATELENNPTDTGLFQFLDFLVSIGSLDPETKAKIDAASRSVEEKARIALTNANAEGGQTYRDVQEAKSLYDAGIISFSEYLDALDTQISNLDEAIAVNAAEPETLALQAKLARQRVQDVSRRILDRARSLNQFRELSRGTSDPRYNIQQLLAVLETEDFDDPDSQLEVINDIYSNYADIVAERIAKAEEFSEKVAIAARGVQVDLQTRVRSVRVQLLTLSDGFKRTAERLGTALGKSGEDVATLIAQIIVATGETQRDALLSVVDAAIASLEHSIDVLSNSASISLYQAIGIGRRLRQFRELQDQIANDPSLNFEPVDLDVVRGDPGAPPAGEDAADRARELAEAQLDYWRAVFDRNPIRLAQAELREADIMAQFAETEADRIRAEAQRIRANRQLQDAIFEIANSYTELAIAIADSAGDVIEVASLQLRLAQDRLAQAISQGAGQAEVNQLNSQIIQQQAQLRDAQLQERLAVINFNLEMENITREQALAQLEALVASADILGLTEQQVRDLLLQIKRLRDEAQSSLDLQLNIPANIRLPTRYEALRVQQAGGAQSYQDNRQIVVQITAQTNATAEDIGTYVTQAVSAPPRYGTQGRLY